MNTKTFLFGSLPASDSPSGVFNKTDLLKWGRHLVIVVSGAAVSALLDTVIKFLTGLTAQDFGEYQILYMALSFVITSGGLEALRRYVSDNMPKE
jgi:hypothetical protein